MTKDMIASDSLIPTQSPVTSKILFVLALMIFGIFYAGVVSAADPFAQAEVTVTENIVATGVEPIGANLTSITGGTNFAVNNHIQNSGL